MVKFNYTGNHKEDGAYMRRMCAESWAAVSLTEGIWTFEPCKPGQYVYRMAYMRGKSADETKEFREKCAEKGIEFVSQYSFWAIFRSEHPFEFYTGDEEKAICEKIYRPMPAGAAVSLAAFILFTYLAVRVSRWFLIPDILIFIYGFVCTRCAVSYHSLLKKFRRK